MIIRRAKTLIYGMFRVTTRGCPLVRLELALLHLITTLLIKSKGGGEKDEI